MAALITFLREFAAKVNWSDLLGVLWRALSEAQPKAQTLLDNLVQISEVRDLDVRTAE